MLTPMNIALLGAAAVLLALLVVVRMKRRKAGEVKPAATPSASAAPKGPVAMPQPAVSLAAAEAAATLAPPVEDEIVDWPEVEGAQEPAEEPAPVVWSSGEVITEPGWPMPGEVGLAWPVAQNGNGTADAAARAVEAVVAEPDAPAGWDAAEGGEGFDPASGWVVTTAETDAAPAEPATALDETWPSEPAAPLSWDEADAAHEEEAPAPFEPIEPEPVAALEPVEAVAAVAVEPAVAFEPEIAFATVTEIEPVMTYEPIVHDEIEDTAPVAFDPVEGIPAVAELRPAQHTDDEPLVVPAAWEESAPAIAGQIEAAAAAIEAGRNAVDQLARWAAMAPRNGNGGPLAPALEAASRPRTAAAAWASLRPTSMGPAVDHRVAEALPFLRGALDAAAPAEARSGAFALGGYAAAPGEEAVTGVAFPESDAAPRRWRLGPSENASPGTLVLNVEETLNCDPADVAVITDPGFAPTAEGFLVRIAARDAGPFAARGTFRVR